MNVLIKSSLAAPCGMNCALCIGYQREKNKCAGCNSLSSSTAAHCGNCSIRNCQYLTESRSKFCFDCGRYPCIRLRKLDTRYRTKYAMSMIENLNFIKKNGIRKFIRAEKEKWTCPDCRNIICVHRTYCLVCGKTLNKLNI